MLHYPSATLPFNYVATPLCHAALLVRWDTLMPDSSTLLCHVPPHYARLPHLMMNSPLFMTCPLYLCKFPFYGARSQSPAPGPAHDSRWAAEEKCGILVLSLSPSSCWSLWKVDRKFLESAKLHPSMMCTYHVVDNIISLSSSSWVFRITQSRGHRPVRLTKLQPQHTLQRP
jgi:hypothetical protein